MGKISNKPDSSSNYFLPLFYNETELFNADKTDFYRLILVEKGSGFFKFNEEKRLLVTPAIFCLNESDRVSATAISGLTAESIAFHPSIVNQSLSYSRIKEESVNSITERLDFDSLRPFVLRNQYNTGQFHVGPATFQQVKQLIKSIGNHLQNPIDPFWPCRSRTSLLEILFLLFRLSISDNPIDELPLKNEAGRADQIILYLVRNYRQKITIDELSKTFNLNRNTLYKLFHEATGIPLITYLIKLRIKMAVILLQETNLPIIDIMEQVGYLDLTHFGRTFKKEIGCTPSEYRLLHKITI